MSERPDIAPVGHIPELGVMTEKMHADVIRPERFGEPKQSFEPEAPPVWDLGPGEVLVQVMAAACLVGAPRPGLKNLAETRVAAANA